MDFNEIAKQGNKIEDELSISIDAIMHKITQEIGELNDAIQKMRGIYAKRRFTKEEVQGEFGDVFFNLISLARRFGISFDDIQESTENTLMKFKERKELYKKIQTNNY